MQKSTTEKRIEIAIVFFLNVVVGGGGGLPKLFQVGQV